MCLFYLKYDNDSNLYRLKYKYIERINKKYCKIKYPRNNKKKIKVDFT